MPQPDMSIWTDRDDTAIEGPDAVRWHQRVQPYSDEAKPGVVLIGFACDEGVRRNGGRVGAKDGPRAIRKALAKLPGAIMPAVSAPAGRGVPLQIVEQLAGIVAASSRLKAVNVVEFNPAYDNNCQAAKTAAGLV